VPEHDVIQEEDNVTDESATPRKAVRDNSADLSLSVGKSADGKSLRPIYEEASFREESYIFDKSVEQGHMNAGSERGHIIGTEGRCSTKRNSHKPALIS